MCVNSDASQMYGIPDTHTLPQMYALYMDPEGRSVFDRTRPSDRPPPHHSNQESIERSGRAKGAEDSYRMEEKVCGSL